jgi:hypothetical protein
MNIRRPLLIGAVVLASVGWSAPAHAGGGSLFVSGSRVSFVADTGVANHVTVRLSGGYVHVDDIDDIDVGPGCTHPSSDLTIARCAATGVDNPVGLGDLVGPSV